MDLLVIIGAITTLVGLIGIVVFIRKISALRHEGLDDAAMKLRLQGLLPLNLGAFLVATLGIMMVIVGLIL